MQRMLCLACVLTAAAAVQGQSDVVSTEELAAGAAAAPAETAAPLLPGASAAGTIESVTVYRGQALVTRRIALEGPAGLRELVVTGLPEHIVPGSLYGEAEGGTEIRAVRYRVRPVGEDVRAEVRQLDERILALQDQLQANERFAQLAAQRAAYLDKLEEFTAATAKLELSQGVLNAQTLTALSAFLFDQRQAATESDLQLARERRGLNEQLELLGRQRGVISNESARTQREAVMLINVPAAEGAAVRLRYLVNEATWSPSYTARAELDRPGVLLEYNAAVQQMSGEDWTDVAMTLSTATPSLVARAPVLEPLTIALRPAGEPPAQAAKGYVENKRELAQQKRQVQQQRALQVPPQPFAGHAPVQKDAGQWLEVDLHLNQIATDLQVLELVGRGKGGPVPEPEEGFSVTYPVAGRSTLPSRSDQQLIQIARLPLKAEFTKMALPVLTDFVYDEATVTNDSAIVLLAGPVASYRAGEFVGHGSLATVAIGEPFTLGFGIDAALRAARELVDKKETVQGGNRVVELTYRLALENFGSTPATVRLRDRLPVVRESEIKLTLVEPGRELRTEPAAPRNSRKTGFLTWDLAVPARAAGAGALAFEYTFRLEYDKGMSIAGLPLVGP